MVGMLREGEGSLQGLLHPDMLDVFVKFDGPVLPVSRTLVKRRDAALCVQVHFRGSRRLGQSLGFR